jgi:hypothetical protein
MNRGNSDRPRPLTLVDGTLAGIAIVSMMMGYSVARYPASLELGRPSFLGSAAALLAYAAFAVLARRGLLDPGRTALARGAGVGIVLGLLAGVNLLVEHFGSLGDAWRAGFGVGMWGAMFLGFAAAGSATYREVGSIVPAVGSSVWGSMVSTVITVGFGFSLALLAMPHMQQILAPAFARSGMTDPQAFVIRNTLDAASTHLLIAPFVAVTFGLAGGLACALLGHVRRGVAVALGFSGLLLLVAGLLSIRFASMIERPQRPPFIMAGLLALGLALSCAHPILTALRRPPRPA